MNSMNLNLPWAALSLERDPLELFQVLSVGSTLFYLLTVGGLASLCAFLWFLAGGFRKVFALKGFARLAVLLLLACAGKAAERAAQT